MSESGAEIRLLRNKKFPVILISTKAIFSKTVDLFYMKLWVETPIIYAYNMKGLPQVPQFSSRKKFLVTNGRFVLKRTIRVKAS